MTVLYSELRATCKQRGITQDDIAQRIGHSRAYVSLKLNGDGAWDQADMYTILDMIHEPYRKMHIYFPLGGIWAGPAEDPPRSEDDQLLAAIKAVIKKVTS